MDTGTREDETALLSTVSRAHALYYIVTGVWPVLSIRTFELITGRKRDRWLVKATGLLIGVIGVVVLSTARAKRWTPEIVLLAISSAAVLAIVDVVYYLRGVLRWVYLGDALAEIALVVGWAIGWRRASASPPDGNSP